MWRSASTSAASLRAAAWSPSSKQWLAPLRQNGISSRTITPRLMDNTSVIAVRGSVWRRLTPTDAIRFAGVVAQVLSGQLRLAYCNPYVCFAGLDFLHTHLWLSAGHGPSRTPLATTDLSRSTVTGGFDLFQQRFRPVIQASVLGARDTRQLAALRDRYRSALVLSCPLDSSTASS